MRTVQTTSLWLAPLVSLALTGCAASAARPAAHKPEEQARAALTKQAASWNAGDLEAALEDYCPSPDITWVHGQGVTHGYDEFARSMREEFGGREDMGTLSNVVLQSRDLSHEMSLVTLRWSVSREGKEFMGGVSSQIWGPCAGRLRIVFDHAS